MKRRQSSSLTVIVSSRRSRHSPGSGRREEASEATVQQAIQEAAKLENPGLSGKRSRDDGQITQAPAEQQTIPEQGSGPVE